MPVSTVRVCPSAPFLSGSGSVVEHLLAAHLQDVVQLELADVPGVVRVVHREAEAQRLLALAAHAHARHTQEGLSEHTVAVPAAGGRSR